MFLLLVIHYLYLNEWQDIFNNMAEIIMMARESFWTEEAHFTKALGVVPEMPGVWLYVPVVGVWIGGSRLDCSFYHGKKLSTASFHCSPRYYIALMWKTRTTAFEICSRRVSNLPLYLTDPSLPVGTSRMATWVAKYLLVCVTTPLPSTSQIITVHAICFLFSWCVQIFCNCSSVDG